MFFLVKIDGHFKFRSSIEWPELNVSFNLNKLCDFMPNKFNKWMPILLHFHGHYSEVKFKGYVSGFRSLDLSFQNQIHLQNINNLGLSKALRFSIIVMYLKMFSYNSITTNFDIILRFKHSKSYHRLHTSEYVKMQKTCSVKGKVEKVKGKKHFLSNLIESKNSFHI